MMTTMTNKIKSILNYLDELFPSVGCELNYQKDYELVIAVMLSAQTSDKAVNKVTNVLFYKYQSLQELANSDLTDIENIIQSIGLYKNKAKNIQGIAKKLISDFNDAVPIDKKDLQTLPGVGNKTAGVIRAKLFNIPELPVDTHILRISKRLGLANEKDDPLIVEKKLKKLIDESRYIKTHHQLIHFGRYFCKAKHPSCYNCKIKDFCNNK